MSELAASPKLFRVVKMGNCLSYDNRLDGFVAALPDGWHGVMALWTERQARTRRQNRYLHWVIDRVREAWAAPFWVIDGITTPNRDRRLVSHKAAHASLLTVFGPTDAETPIGAGRKSETTYTVQELSQLINDIREWAREEMGWHIPSAEEWDEEAA